MKSAHHLLSQPLLLAWLPDARPGGNRRARNPSRKLRALVAVSLVLLFVAFRTAFLPVAAVLAAGFSDDHAVRFVAADGHWNLVLSHHDQKASHHDQETSHLDQEASHHDQQASHRDQQAHAAELLAGIPHDHQHGWVAGLLVTMAESPVPDGDHVIQFSLSDQVATAQLHVARPVATPGDTLCPPTAQLVPLTTWPAVAPVAAARPPPVSPLLLSLRTTVLVV